MKTNKHFRLPSDPKPDTVLKPATVNRYCGKVQMCLDTDPQHEPDCPKHQRPSAVWPYDDLKLEPKGQNAFFEMPIPSYARKTAMNPAMAAPYGKVEAAATYKVLLHNNDRTPFENVVKTLAQVFKLTANKAEELMYKAHNAGARGTAVVRYGLTEGEAKTLADLAVKYAASLPNQRNETLKFSAAKV